MTSVSTDRPNTSVVALLAGLAVGFALVMTTGQPLQWAHVWPAGAVLCWVVAVLSPRWARTAFLCGLLLFGVWHVGAMAASQPRRIIPVGPWYYG